MPIMRAVLLSRRTERNLYRQKLAWVAIASSFSLPGQLNYRQGTSYAHCTHELNLSVVLNMNSSLSVIFL